MGFIEDIRAYAPMNEQEARDQTTMLDFIARYPSDVLLRENRIAHITSSGFVVNEQYTHALLINHDIMGKWAWPGGHADGDEDLLGVALREVFEETGVEAAPLVSGIASLDILPVGPHYKNGAFVNAHLHLSVAYVLAASDEAPLRALPGENTGARWFPLNYFSREHFSEYDAYLYGKLIERARSAQ